jgi:hypothetical protein
MWLGPCGAKFTVKKSTGIVCPAQIVELRLLLKIVPAEWWARGTRG